MHTCPHCHATRYQVKAGFNRSGSQRYRCNQCGKKYTPDPKPQGYPDHVRHLAVRLYVDGMNLRRIARTLNVNHQSVANWVTTYVEHLPAAPLPADPPEVIEMDELFTFVGSKKKQSTS
jgi:transposase-like protein